MPRGSDSDDGVSRLVTPVRFDSFLNDGLTEFEIKSDDLLTEEHDTDVENVYPLEKLEPFLLTQDYSDEEEPSFITQDFEKLSKYMTNVREDGKVMKKIDRTGTGGLIPEDGTVWNVYVHYAGYVEFGDYPYDATRLRGKKPVKFRLDDFFTGMAIAIRSMRKGEKSKFLIHPDLAFGENGVPPRIPPSAQLLFEIELFDFCPSEEGKDNSVPDKPETYLDKIEKAKKCRERGNKRKKQEKDTTGAITQYRRGIYILMESPVADKKEEDEMHAELIKLYQNLASSYLAKKEYRRVCSTFNDAMHDCPVEASKSVKLNYLSAKALRFLGDYVEAKKRIRKANKLKQGDEDIFREMTELEETIKTSKKSEVECARRMFGHFNSRENSKETEESLSADLDVVDDQFKNTFNEFIDEFLNDDEKTVERMNVKITLAEKVYCKRVCQSKKILIRELGPEDNKELIFTKTLL